MADKKHILPPDGLEEEAPEEETFEAWADDREVTNQPATHDRPQVSSTDLAGSKSKSRHLALVVLGFALGAIGYEAISQFRSAHAPESRRDSDVGGSPGQVGRLPEGLHSTKAKVQAPTEARARAPKKARRTRRRPRSTLKSKARARTLAANASGAPTLRQQAPTTPRPPAPPPKPHREPSPKNDPSSYELFAGPER